MKHTRAATFWRCGISATGAAAVLGALAAFASIEAYAASMDGPTVYAQRCAACHDAGADRTPPRAQLQRMSTEEIVAALVRGTMQVQASGLSTEEIRSVAAFLGARGRGQEVAAPRPNPCTKPAASLDLRAPSWNGWSVDLANTRYQSKPGVKAADVPRLKVKWAYAYHGRQAIGQPSIVSDRIFVTSVTGKVSALDARSGCELWTFDADGTVRTPVVVAQLPKGGPAKYAAFFGNNNTAVEYAVDAETGKLLWQTKVDAHVVARLTGAPVYYDGRLYVPVSSHEEPAAGRANYQCCTFRGAVVALDASTGNLVWKGFGIPKEPTQFKLNAEGKPLLGPAGGAIWSAPTIDVERGRIYAGTGNSYTDADTDGGNDSIVAFDLNTGRRVWANQVTPNDNFLMGCGRDKKGKGNCPEQGGPDFDFGSSPILATMTNGKQIIVAGQKSGMVYGLDPDNGGKTLWQTRVGKGSALGGIEWGMAADDRLVYVPVSDVGARQDGTPGIYAIELTTGKVTWAVPTPTVECAWGSAKCERAQAAAATVIPGVVFSGAFDGHLRAYSTKDGKIIWDYDTAPEMKTVNGLPVEGGTIDSGGVTIADGMVLINSGYGSWGKPGRLLLMFTVDGK